MTIHDAYSFSNTGPWALRGTWPCRWITLPHPPPPPFLGAYRLTFTLQSAATLRLHVSADERYELFCDGERLGRGPERGDAANWYYESYTLPLPAGIHTLAARVWSLGEQAPYAQMSIRHGFLLGAEGEFLPLVSTGVAAWEGKVVSGCEFLPAGLVWGAGARLKIDGAAYPWGVERGEGENWQSVTPLHPGVNASVKNEWPALHRLKPATLPPQLEDDIHRITLRHIDATPAEETECTPVQAKAALPCEMTGWQRLLDTGHPVLVPAHTTRRILLDFSTYQSAYPEITVSGGRGSRIRIHWAEGLYEGTTGGLSKGGAADARGKGNRDVIEDKCFIGAGDCFLPDGGESRCFETLWWSAGRYIEISIETTDSPLTLTRIAFRETRYPLTMEGSLYTSDPRCQEVTRLALRTLEMCSHETYMDCPYYEQLQYIGDTRLQVLTTYVLTRDDRLPRKALQMGFASILGDRGLAQSRYPSRVTQVIPPFSLWWVAMLHDFALWRGDLPFIRSLMPGARQILDTFLLLIGDDGLMQSPEGWNFTDWVPAWTETTRDFRNWGVPPDGENGVSAVLNWHLVYTLKRAAELEEWLGEHELALRWKRRAVALARQIDTAFWNPSRGLYADDRTHAHFSEHAQLLALLSGVLPGKRSRPLSRRLFRDPALERATIYFSHYLFEAAGNAGQIEPLFDRLEEIWFPLPGRGYTAMPEEPEPCRSDCHAWGAHPLYHFYATLLGIRPAVPGGRHLVIRPQLGPLNHISGRLPHPDGEVTLTLERHHGALRGELILPPGVTASLEINGTTCLPTGGGPWKIAGK